MFLLIEDVVLCTRDHATLLNPFYCFGHRNTCQVWIRREAFPIPTTRRYTTERPSYGTQLDINAFAAELVTHGYTTLPHEVSAKRRRDADASWENRVLVR